ncbi:hypothetical protein J2805_000946 [Arthrobacter oryzae]|nr:hypothetical protein [Arthrobacter oryzae]
MSPPENQPQRGDRKGYHARQVESEAERQGLTVEEYWTVT